MTLQRLHIGSAVLLTLYAIVHIANHLIGLGGVEAHMAFMAKVRVVTRVTAVESVLLLAVAAQVYTGVVFVVRGWRARHGIVPWLQAASGAYLAFFLLNHVGAVLAGRAVFELDTNFYFAAAGLHIAPFHFFFVPYYFLGVLALFTHLGCATYWRFATSPVRVRRIALGIPIAAGIVVATLIVMTLLGVFFSVEIPTAYRAMFGQDS